MHDPMVVAHEIRYPWYAHRPWPKKRRKNPDPWQLQRHWQEMSESEKSHLNQLWPEGYRNLFITIWHVDPEKDGSDDSCGYSYVKLTPHQRERLRNAAWHEGQNPHFLCWPGKQWGGSNFEAECLYTGMVLLVCRVLRIKITFDQAHKYAAEACHIRDIGKAGDCFCFLPGYHTNSEKDSKEDRQEHFWSLLCQVARAILTDRRPWWKHPKWHFWHWQIQCHPLCTFKRWAFSRCCKCGKRFSWGYSPVSHNWNSEGPRWFRSEPDIFHSDCSHPNLDCIGSNEQGT